MKIQFPLKTSLVLVTVLALTCITTDELSATPLQSGSRSESPVTWSQAEPINQAQLQYDSPMMEQSQPTYSEEVIVDSGHAQPACSSCAPAPVASSSCGCNKPNCNRALAPRKGCGICKRSRGCTQCPSCEGDICKLELDKSKITKTRFKSEQESVCIPPVRLPWQKCCPPGKSKTRVVNRLKTEKYECPHCAYKWSLVKPEKAEEPELADPADNPQTYESTPVYDSYLPAQGEQIIPAETYTPEAIKSEVITPLRITPEAYTPPRVDATLGKPATSKLERVVPPPPTMGRLPWRAGSPTS